MQALAYIIVLRRLQSNLLCPRSRLLTDGARSSRLSGSGEPSARHEMCMQTATASMKIFQGTTRVEAIVMEVASRITAKGPVLNRKAQLQLRGRGRVTSRACTHQRRHCRQIPVGLPDGRDSCTWTCAKRFLMLQKKTGNLLYTPST